VFSLSRLLLKMIWRNEKCIRSLEDMLEEQQASIDHQVDIICHQKKQLDDHYKLIFGKAGDSK
jgi:hypothetical protein